MTLVQQMLVMAARWRISCWDATIVDTARALRCATLLSENLQREVSFAAGVRVENPFR